MSQVKAIRGVLLIGSVVIIATLGGLFCQPPPAVFAQDPEPTPWAWTTNPQGTRVPWPTPGGAAPGPTGPSGPQLPDVGAIITQFIQHVLVFPAKSLQETLEKAVASTLKGNIDYMRDPLETALHLTIFSTPTIRGGSLGPQGMVLGALGANAFEDAWGKVRTVTFFLYPILLAIAGLSITSRNALGAGGAQSQDIGEVLVKWFFIVLTSGLSIYLCDWVNRLCNALAGLFLSMPTAAWLVNAVFLGASSVMVIGGGPVLGLMLGVFMAVVGLLVLVALLMQYVARYVLLYILVAIAPLGILALGLNETRWLGYLWLKGFIMVCLLQPISALIFSLMYMIAQSGLINGLVDPIGSFVKFGVAVGCLSVLLTINYTVVRGVFGTIGEIMQKGKDTAMGVGSMMMRTVMIGGAAVAGLAGLGAGGAGALGGAGGGGAGGAGALGGAGGGAGALGGAGGGAGGAGEAGAQGAGGSGAGAATEGTDGATSPSTALRTSSTAQGGFGGLDRGRLGSTMEMVGSGLSGSRGAMARTAGGLLRTMGRNVSRGAQEEHRQQEAAGPDGGRESAYEAQQTTRERQGEYRDYARQMTGDPGTQRDVVAGMDLLSNTWGHSQVREALPGVTNALSLATGRGGPAGGEGQRTNLSRLAEEHGHISATGDPMPAHFVAGQVEDSLIARHGGQGEREFAPTQAGLTAPSAAPASFENAPPSYADYQQGVQIAAGLGRGDERESARVYGSLYANVRQATGSGTGATPQAAQTSRMAFANELVTQAPAIATQARAAGESPEGAFAHYVSDRAGELGYTSRDLGDAWTNHVASL